MNSSVPAPQGDDEPGVARELAELAQALQAEALQAEGGRLGTLQTVCELAVKVIDADHASITVRHDGRLRTLAATSDLAETLGQVQRESADALHVGHDGDQAFVTGDLSQEAGWPELAVRAAQRAGIHSVLSSPLQVRDGEVGHLDAFAHRRDAFNDSAVAIFGVFAAHAGLALQAAEEQERADNLEIALRNSRRIGTALGILMHSHRIDEPHAFDLLRRRSQDTNRKLADVADAGVRTGGL